MENAAIITKGFQIIRAMLTPYIGRELTLEYGSGDWWGEGVMKVLREDQ